MNPSPPADCRPLFADRFSSDNPSTNMNPNPNKIALNIDDDAKVSIKGFIASIEHTQSNYHLEFEWDELVNLRVAVPEKEHSASVFRAFLRDEVVREKSRILLTKPDCFVCVPPGARTV